VQQPDEEGSEADDPVDNCEEQLLDGAEQPPELCYGISPLEYSGVKSVFRPISCVVCIPLSSPTCNYTRLA
jgi:hypothetical protein